MKRRKFLQLLGLAPAIPLLAKLPVPEETGVKLPGSWEDYESKYPGVHPTYGRTQIATPREADSEMAYLLGKGAFAKAEHIPLRFDT